MSGMDKPLFVVLGASPEDLPRIAELQHQACATDPGFSSIYPNPPSTAALSHLTRQYEDMMDNDSTAHIMIAKEAMHGEIASFAIYHLLRPKPAEKVEEEMLADVDTTAFPPEANVELGRALVRQGKRKRVEVASVCFGLGRPYGYLAAVGTSTKFQKQGAASKLIQWVVAQVDDNDLPMYVESTAAGRNLYQKFGFREYDRLKLDLPPKGEGDVTNICMVRFPNVE